MGLALFIALCYSRGSGASRVGIQPTGFLALVFSAPRHGDCITTDLPPWLGRVPVSLSSFFLCIPVLSDPSWPDSTQDAPRFTWRVFFFICYSPAMRPIVQEDAPVLRKVASPVPEELFGSSELMTLIRDMAEALDTQPEGVALAAPQIDVSYRLFIVRKDRTLSADELEKRGGTKASISPEIETYINPEIIETSRRHATAEEGCLSVRGVYGTTRPHERVTLRARREDGTHFERGAGGLMAQIFEHEVNHLNGILFIDHAEHLIHIPHDSVE